MVPRMLVLVLVLVLLTMVVVMIFAFNLNLWTTSKHVVASSIVQSARTNLPWIGLTNQPICVVSSWQGRVLFKVVSSLDNNACHESELEKRMGEKAADFDVQVAFEPTPSPS
eukprot:2346180-Rhodomonas_salina.9